jgi:hypothetical protein
VVSAATCRGVDNETIEHTTTPKSLKIVKLPIRDLKQKDADEMAPLVIGLTLHPTCTDPLFRARLLKATAGACSLDPPTSFCFNSPRTDKSHYSPAEWPVCGGDGKGLELPGFLPSHKDAFLKIRVHTKDLIDYARQETNRISPLLNVICKVDELGPFNVTMPTNLDSVKRSKVPCSSPDLTLPNFGKYLPCE